MKVQTIEQFYIFEFIRKHFSLEYVTLEIVDDTALKLTDYKGDCNVFSYINGEIVYWLGGIGRVKAIVSRERGCFN